MKTSIIVLSAVACIVIAPAVLAQDGPAKASHQTRKHHPPHGMQRAGATKSQPGYFAGAARDASGSNRDLDASRQAGGGCGM